MFPALGTNTVKQFADETQVCSESPHVAGRESSGKNSMRAVREGFLEEAAPVQKEMGKMFSGVVTCERGLRSLGSLTGL